MKSRADRRRSCNDESLMPKSVAQQRVSKHGPPRPSRRRAEEARLPGSSPGQALRMRRREISIIQKAPQLPRPTRMLQLPQRFRLDLADALSRHRELLADFFERVVGVHADAEAHAQDAFLARGQRGQNPRGGLAKVALDRGIDGQDRVLVLDEIAEMGVFLV